MASYQNVGTPRFYINEPLWLLSNNSATISNNTSFPNNIFNLNPSVQYSNELAFGQGNDITVNLTNGYNYIAWLGHNFSDAQYRMHPISEHGITIAADSGINYVENSVPSFDGFTFQFFNQTTLEVNIGFFKEGETPTIGKCCSISVGRYYEMPHSPDLSLTLTREYGGIKTIETKGGASLSNAFYTKPPAWGDLGAWEVGGGDPRLSKSGRRTWDLSFSYLSDSSVFPDVSALRNYEIAGYSAGVDATINTLLNGDDFYGQVIHKTNGGQLPFIFQPDSSNNNPDQFAICKLDMKSFKYDQVANGVYNMKLKIREVW